MREDIERQSEVQGYIPQPERVCSRIGLAGVLRGRELGFNEPIRILPYKEQAMTKEQIIHCVSVLKEVQKDFRFNTNIDTAIREYESRLKELEK